MTQQPSAGAGTIHKRFIADNAASMGYQAYFGRLLSTSIGGVLPGLDLGGITQVLDVGCGPGRWVIDVAKTYPQMEVCGIDGAAQAIEYGEALAFVEHADNVSFRVMDPAKPFDFPDNTFDLTNMTTPSFKYAKSKAAWPVLLREAARVTRPGGLVRVIEYEHAFSNSPSNQKLVEATAQAFYRAGMSFSPDGRSLGIAVALKDLLRDAGCSDVRQVFQDIDASWGEPIHQPWMEHYTILHDLVGPFVTRVGMATDEEHTAWFEQVLAECAAGTYKCHLLFVIAWGRVN